MGRETQTRKKEISQFFTGQKLARYMVNLWTPKRKAIVVIDPGAGSGVLSQAFVEQWGALTQIHLIAIEKDVEILPDLKNTLEELSIRFTDFKYEIRQGDYLLMENLPVADFIISNPPYRKIGVNSQERAAVGDICVATNLYAAFLIKSVCGLREGGELVYLIPRSWTAGLYFFSLRVFLRKNGAITHLGMFRNRRHIFPNEAVLQDVIVMRFQRGEDQGVCSLDFLDDAQKSMIPLPVSFFYAGEQQVLLLPSSCQEVSLITYILRKGQTLKQIGNVIRTGVVVQFRAKDRIYSEKHENTIPLLTTHLIFHKKTDSLLYIQAKKSERVKNQWYVFLSRILPKENSGIFQIVVYDPSLFCEDEIAIDLNLCFIPCQSKQEAVEIERVLHSEVCTVMHRAVQSGNQISTKLLMELPIVLSH